MSTLTGSPPPLRRALLTGLLLASAVGLLYGPALDGPFIYDDMFHIRDNPALRHLERPGEVLRCGYQETRPVFLLSLALNFRLLGGEPRGFHLVNLALHLACCLLLLALGQRLYRDLGAPPGTRLGPPLAALIFAVHPLCTESVAYINSRSGLLAAAFGLGSLLCSLRALEGPRLRGPWFAGGLGLLLLALGSKESAAVLPALLLLYLALIRGGGAWRRPSLLAYSAAVLLVPLLFLLVKNPHHNTVGAGTGVPLVQHWMTQVRVLATFWGLMLAPVQQNLDYDFRLSTTLLDPALWGAAALVGCLLAAAWLLRRRRPLVSFSLAWFFVAVAPTNSLVPFADFIAERHLYLPMMGYALLASHLLAGLAAGRWQDRRRWLLAGAAAAYLLCLGLLTVARNRVLADPEALWRETVAASPNKARPHLNLAVHLMARQATAQEGYGHLQRALELDPAHPRTHYNLGVYRERTGDLDGAVTAFRQAASRSDNPLYHRSLARALGREGTELYARGRLREAEGRFAEAIRADPAYDKAHFNRAVVLDRLGEPRAARREARRTLELNPGHARARELLLRLGQQPGQPDPAADSP